MVVICSVFVKEYSEGRVVCLVFSVVYVVGCSEYDIFRYLYCIAEAYLFILINESKRSKWSMQQLSFIFIIHAEKLLVSKSVVFLAVLLVAHFNLFDLTNQCENIFKNG